MPVKSWICPGCRRAFIVDRDSTRDVCPWCHAAVEEHGGTVRLVEEHEQPADARGETDPHAPQPAA